ncbi:MAG: Uncharacterized protein Greene041619_374 [Candidatus Peregrinibacteria bacterium Greene0416_19]|nr:MAG: Uncharacterized protein Greene041619_374 [Candidatus Peregrinibacteria bacterium Greene0416_19]
MDTMTPPAAGGKSGSSKLLGTVLVVALIVLLIVIDAKRRAAVAQLEQLSLRLEQLTGNPEKNKEEAKKVVDQLRQIYDLPTDVEPTVATIVDAAALAKQNDFYKQARNGDNLIITPQRAILFRASENRIIDVVPVQIQPPAGQPQGQVQGGTPPPGTPAPKPALQPAPQPAPEPAPEPVPEGVPAQ